MDNVFMVGSVIAVASVLLAGFMLYSVYGGFRASLDHAKIGEVYNFEYEQPLHGDPERFLAKVIEPVYTLDDRQIARLNRKSSYRRGDASFKRTKNLVVCATPDGKIRQFYAERVKNCRKPLFAGLLFHKMVAAVL